jgi:hypothetical protein
MSHELKDNAITDDNGDYGGRGFEEMRKALEEGGDEMKTASADERTEGGFTKEEKDKLINKDEDEEMGDNLEEGIDEDSEGDRSEVDEDTYDADIEDNSGHPNRFGFPRTRKLIGGRKAKSVEWATSKARSAALLDESSSEYSSLDSDFCGWK